MLSLKLFSRFVQLNLGSLGLGDFFVQLVLFTVDFKGQLLDLKVQLSDFRIIFFVVLLKSYIVFFLLLACNGPLLQFLLIPVQLQLNLLNLFICSENSNLDVI